MKKLLFLFLLIPFLSHGQLQLPFGIKVLNPQPLDYYYYNNSGIPYVSTTQANTQISSSIRYMGQTVLIGTVEYCYKTGITDGDLVIKNVGGGGVSTFTALTDGPGTYTGRSLNFVRVNVGETGLEYQTIAQVKSNMSLNLVDNTPDAGKPVSTLQQVVIDAKVADAINDGTTTIAPSQNVVYDGLALKQDVLVSGTSIKTIGGVSILGSGNIPVGGTGTVTNVSSVDANATVATQTTTPVITIVSAPKFATGRTIGITGDVTYTSPSFDGTGNVTASSTVTKINGNTVPSNAAGVLTNNGSGTLTWGTTSIAASALTGTTLASNVLASSLTSVGTLASLAVTGNAKAGTVYSGTTTAYTAKSIYFFGDSKTDGSTLADPTLRWTTRVASILGFTEVNKGVSGQSMYNGMDGRLSEIPTYSSSIPYLFYSYGTNDYGTGYTTTQFQTAFQVVLDASYAKGWPTSAIYILNLTPNTAQPTSITNFNVIINGLPALFARNAGLNIIDVYSIFSGSGTSRYFSGTHENVIGSDKTAQAVIAVMPQPDVLENSQTGAFNGLVEAKSLRLKNITIPAAAPFNFVVADKTGNLQLKRSAGVYIENSIEASAAQTADTWLDGVVTAKNGFFVGYQAPPSTVGSGLHVYTSGGTAFNYSGAADQTSTIPFSSIASNFTYTGSYLRASGLSATGLSGLTGVLQATMGVFGGVAKYYGLNSSNAYCDLLLGNGSGLYQRSAGQVYIGGSSPSSATAKFSIDPGGAVSGSAPMKLLSYDINATTGASGTGTVATITFSALPNAIPINTVVNISGITPSGYNQSFATVTASSTTSISYANTTTGAQTVAGKIVNALLVTPEVGAMERRSGLYATTSSLNRLAIGGKIAGFNTTVSNTSTTETDLFTYTTKANTLGDTDEEIEFTGCGTFSDITATAQVRFYFAGTNIGNTGALTVSAVGGFTWNVSIKRTGLTTASASVDISTPGASTAIYTSQTDLTGLTFTGTNIIKVTGTAAGAGGGTGDISGKHGKIMWWPAANN